MYSPLNTFYEVKKKKKKRKYLNLKKNDMLLNTCMRLKQQFYIIQHSNIKFKIVCSV